MVLPAWRWVIRFAEDEISLHALASEQNSSQKQLAGTFGVVQQQLLTLPGNIHRCCSCQIGSGKQSSVVCLKHNFSPGPAVIDY